MWNPSVFGEHLNKGLELNFWPILKVKLCFVLDKFSVFVNIRRRYCHTGWAKKLSFKLLFIYMYSPKSDGFYIFYISKWGVAACLVITLLQIFHIMRQWKNFENGQYLTKIWTNLCGLLFGPPCICMHMSALTNSQCSIRNIVRGTWLRAYIWHYFGHSMRSSWHQSPLVTQGHRRPRGLIKDARTVRFLADRAKGGTYATMLRPSVVCRNDVSTLTQGLHALPRSRW